jgi:hypothetical protein
MAQTEALFRSELDDLEREIARRARWRSTPGAPAWPSGLPDLKPFWEAIKSRVSVADFYRRHSLGILYGADRNLRGNCPICEMTGFHRRRFGERDDAFSIYHGEQLWHCFRCGNKGDLYTLAQWVFRDTRFAQVAFNIADEFGIDRPRDIVPEVPDPYTRGEPGGIRKRKKPTFRGHEVRGGKVVAAR